MTKYLGDKHWIKEILTSNGLSDDSKSDLKQVKTIEFVLSSLPKIPVLAFKNLTSLQLIGSNIKVIENLEPLVYLNELWIAEANLKCIERLEKNTELQKLYLYDNNIEKIENLSHLTKLEVLWLNKNKIHKIENLESLTLLKVLDLSDNLIKDIGISFDSNKSLEELNLSGNLLTSLKDVANLASIGALRSLGLKDPMSAANPLDVLCNYSLYILHHIPSLHMLDSFPVTQKSLKTFAETIVSKKRVFYKMKVKAIERVFMQKKNALEEELHRLQEAPQASLRKIVYAIKEIERELEEIERRPKSCPVVLDEVDGYKTQLVEKHARLLERVDYWEERHARFYNNFKEVVEQAEKWKIEQVENLQLEFSYGGNIRFEEGTNKDIWYNSCYDLLHSRFSANEYTEVKVSGMKVHRITRVHNRVLKRKFNDKQDNQQHVYKDRQGRRLMDYLFLVCERTEADVTSIIENGFKSKENFVEVTNSVQLADKHRIKRLAQKSSAVVDQCTFRYGKILICKVYTGRSSPISKEKSTEQENYPDKPSVYQTRKHATCPNKQKKNNELCSCTARRCTWFVFDHDLVLVEYIVDFEYLTAVTPAVTLIFSSMEEDRLCGERVNKLYQQSEVVDDQILITPPLLASKPRLTYLTEEGILAQCSATNLSKITVLNLHGSGLSRVKTLSQLNNLNKLILCFNELTTIQDLGGMTSLEYLDVSFNQITTLEGLKSLPNVTSLDISWNSLRQTREEVSLLRKNFSAIKHLRIAHNTFNKPDSVRLRCIGRLHALKSFDGSMVLEDELQTAMRLVVLSRISYVTLLARSRTDAEVVRTWSLEHSAHTLMRLSRNTPIKLADEMWLKNVTCLCLDNEHLSKISNLEALVNLKWASFNNNDITRIEGLESCIMLQELSLDGNCISKLEGLNHLVDLEMLSVSNNNIQSLDAVQFDRLRNLRDLAFDNNYVTTFNGLQKSFSLTEVFAGYNKVEKPREIFHLKNLGNLSVLDLLGNPLTLEAKHYRLFVLYHLQSLKALDGIPVDIQEGSLAKDTFGGKLTADFIVEKLGHSNFTELCELDLPNRSLRTVDVLSADTFTNLRSLNLEQNNLTNFGGIICLENLKVLCLNHNYIESVLEKHDKNSTFLTSLEVLHLGYNSIANMATLQLGCLPSLKALFLQGNEITRVEGLEKLVELREIVLDKNKIKSVNEGAFVGQTKLLELHIEENRLRELKNLEHLEGLQRLYVGLNRIQDSGELEKLELLTNLFEVSLIGNPVARRMMHRPLLIFRQPTLLTIDGCHVTNEERTKAELHFIEQQGGIQAIQAITSTLNQSFPGLVPKSTNLLKVSNYFQSGLADHLWHPFDEDRGQQTDNDRYQNR